MNAKTTQFYVSPSSSTPMYRQLMEQIKRLVASDQLAPGSALPSVRQLSSELAVNPMTISKAYSLLEAEGTLTRIRGKGMIVSDKKEQTLSHDERLALLTPTLEKAATEAKQLELNSSAVIDTFKTLLEN